MKIFELSTNQFEAFIRRDSSSQGMVMPHIHEGYEMSLMLSGNVKYMFKSSSVNLIKGSVALIKPFEIHKTLPTENAFERLLFHFKIDVFSSVFSTELTKECLSVFSNNCLILDQDKTDELKNILLTSKSYLDDEKQDMAVIYLAKALVYLRNISIHNNEKPSTSDISKIMTYINNNVSKVKSSDVCEKFYISQQTLNKIFKKELGITPHKYIEVLRINYSLDLLKDDNLSIDEVAHFCGFSSTSYFTSVFKKTFGEPPKNYRKTMKQHAST